MRKRVCIFGGSRFMNANSNKKAEALGTALGESGFDIVYGGYNDGLMWLVAKSAHIAGADVAAVIPRYWLGEMDDKDCDWRAICSRVFVQEGAINDALHERKKIMLAESDVFLALPGGKGTEDEIVTMMTWRDFGVHTKPIVAWDMPVDDTTYFKNYRDFTDFQINAGLVSEKYRGFISYHSDIPSVVAALSAA